MVGRVTGAGVRATLATLLVATPALLLPSHATEAIELVVLLAILAAGLTFAEYNSNFPSFVEFRDAPPLNRMRFVSLFMVIVLLTMLTNHRIESTVLNQFFFDLGRIVGGWTDFPYSPVRLALLAMPQDLSPETMQTMRIAVGSSYVIAMATVIMFLGMIHILGWPTRNGAFNVWVNLPLFDPTTGGDVVYRLQRDGRINVILGVLLPFIIPAIIKTASNLISPITLDDPQTMIWSISAWAFLPASMIMRGAAMQRIAELIEEKRRRTYASSEALLAA